MDKFCPTLKVVGDKVYLGDPIPLIKPEYLPPELGVWPAVLGITLLKAWPLWAALGGSVVGLHFLRKEAKGFEKVFKAAVPLTATGGGVWVAAQLIPAFKPDRADFPTEKEFTSALNKYRIASGFAWLGVAGLATWGITEVAKALKEEKPPADKEKAPPPKGYQPKPGELVELRESLEATRSEDIVIHAPMFWVLQSWGLVWEAFKIQLRFAIENRGKEMLPALWIRVSDAENAITLFEERTETIPPGQELDLRFVTTLSEWTEGTDLPYLDHIKVRIEIGESEDRVFKDEVFTLAPIKPGE